MCRLKFKKGIDIPDSNYLVEQVKKMSDRGIKINQDIVKMHAEYLGCQQELAENFYKAYGVVNPNSSIQLVNYLSSLKDPEVYGICYNERSKKWTTNKEVIQELSDKGYTFANDLLAYRKMKKYAESLKSIIDNLKAYNMVHPEINITKTNRISYLSPALMNIPKSILWKVIKPINENSILVSADIKNQEPNIMINLLNIEELKNALKDERGLYESLFDKIYKAKGILNILVNNFGENGDIEVFDNGELGKHDKIPPHIYMSNNVLKNFTYYEDTQVHLIEPVTIGVQIGKYKDLSEIEDKLPKTVGVRLVTGERKEVAVKWDIEQKLENKVMVKEVVGELVGLRTECKGDIRKEFKTSWNALTYGASKLGIKGICKTIDSDLLYNYFNNIVEMERYKKDCRSKAYRKEQETETYFGTKLYANEYSQKRLSRVLMDLPIQGTASDILSLLVKHINKYIKENGLEEELEIYYVRHDEIIFQVNPKDRSMEDIKKELHDLVAHQVDDWVPFEIETEILGLEDTVDIDDSTDDVFID